MFAGFALATAAAAQTAPEGASVMSGNSKIKVKGCGKEKGSESWDFGIFDDGDWFAEDSLGGDFCGTSSPVGSNERKRDLSFETVECDDPVDSIEDAASDLCGSAVVLDSGTVDKARFKLNKKETKAKVHLKGSGTSGSDKVKARIKVNGDWGVLPLV